jgi:hypothetical protein
MFTWICPQCGREVPPSEAECPDCARGRQAALEAPAPSAPAAPPARRPGWPAWLLSVLFAVGFAAIGLAGYWGYRSLRSQPAAAPAPRLALESPGPAPAAPAKPHPLARHIEIAGLRLHEDAGRKASVQFLVVNHSGADLGELSADVQLIAVSPKGESEAVGRFSFRVPALGPYEARELKAPLTTQLRVYELPDWQFLRAEFQITSPGP